MEKPDAPDSPSSNHEISSIAFATYAADGKQLQNALLLAESIRTYAGRLREKPIWIFAPVSLPGTMGDLKKRFDPYLVDFHRSDAPRDALQYYYAGKVYAASDAEKRASGRVEILVWMDADTIILGEPSAILLPEDTAFAYRPVMHNRSGSAWDQPPDPFWSRIYEVLSISDRQLFPMITPADGVKIRAYFNAGLLGVRPQRMILRSWSRDFKTLFSDSILAAMCAEDIEKKIFLHQTALVGAVLNRISHTEMIELSDRYNYPIFFDRHYDASHEFDSIESVITLRYNDYFQDPDPQWYLDINGRQDQIDWLKERLGGG